MAEPEKIIVDASVVYKWYAEEEWSKEARSLIEDYNHGHIDIASVSLMPFEVLNALRYTPDIGLLDLYTVTESLEKLSLDIQTLEGELSKRTMENALRYGITVYDSSYLSLGELEDAQVYTADMKLIEKARNTCLKHISSYHSHG